MTERNTVDQRGAVDPVTEQFLESLTNNHSPVDRPPSEAKALLAAAQSIPVGKPSADLQDLVLSLGPAHQLSAVIVRPKNKPGDLPVMIYFCCGGWTQADRNTHDRLVRDIAVGAEVALVVVECERFGSVQFPVSVDQAYAATRYIVDQAGAMGLDGTRLALAGDGVGGGIAAAVTLIAKERRGPKVALQILLCPVTDSNFQTDSYARFADGP